MPLQRLVYTSRLASGVVPDTGQATAKALATTSRRANEARAITGVLTLIDGLFVQVLEGPGDAVEDLFEAICRDLRHCKLNLVDVSPITERLFPSWGMAFLDGQAPGQTPLRARALEQIAFQVTINATETARQLRELLDLAEAPLALAA